MTATTIRPATDADVEDIVAMALLFQHTTKFAQHLRATSDTLRALAARLIAQPDTAIVFVAERDGALVGMIAAALYTHPMSGELWGSEICWWMDPRSRGGRTAYKLLRAAEGWASTRGAVAFQMMAPTPDIGAFYEVLDYVPVETHYLRRLS